MWLAVVCALSVSASASCWATAAALRFDPLQNFWLLCNLRAATLGIIIAGLAIHLDWIIANREEHPAYAALIPVGQVMLVLFGFQLITTEINDLFRWLAAVHPGIDPGIDGWETANGSMKFKMFGDGQDELELWDGTRVRCTRTGCSGTCTVTGGPTRAYSDDFVNASCP